MLPRARLLQIGDIHFPKAQSKEHPMDDQDVSFPMAARYALTSSSPLKAVFQRLYQEISTESIDAVLFMGDLTDVGKLPGYESCCKFITNALQLGSTQPFSQIPVGIVPGNHDIDRSLANNLSTAKFDVLNHNLTSVGLPKLPVTNPIKLPTPNTTQPIDIYLLNSCWGCGEKSYIPDEYSDAISSAIDDIVNRGGDDAIRSYYNRQLDTPALTTESLAALVSEIESTAIERLPVIVAHHNILPQRQTRLAPYTELVNSGALRSTLQELNRPVIYLHGHIHEDPIEIVQMPGGLPLVSISAPEVTGGYNILEFVFSDRGVPIACRVQPHRVDKSGIIRRNPDIVVSLNTMRRGSQSPILHDFYGALMTKKFLYWNDITSIRNSSGQRHTKPQIMEMLEILMSFNLISIENYFMSADSWVVRADL